MTCAKPSGPDRTAPPDVPAPHSPDSWDYLIGVSPSGVPLFYVSPNDADLTEAIYEACCMEAAAAGLREGAMQVCARRSLFVTDDVTHVPWPTYMVTARHVTTPTPWHVIGGYDPEPHAIAAITEPAATTLEPHMGEGRYWSHSLHARTPERAMHIAKYLHSGL